MNISEMLIKLIFAKELTSILPCLVIGFIAFNIFNTTFNAEVGVLMMLIGITLVANIGDFTIDTILEFKDNSNFANMEPWKISIVMQVILILIFVVLSLILFPMIFETFSIARPSWMGVSYVILVLYIIYLIYKYTTFYMKMD